MSLNPQDDSRGPVPDFGGPVPLELDTYRHLHAQSISDREGYWRVQAQRLDWTRPFESVMQEDFSRPEIRWFSGGRLNVAANVLLRHIENGSPDTPALGFIRPGEPTRFVTYAQLLEQVQQAARSLIALGAGPDKPVALYLTNRPEAVILALACAWLGIPYGAIAKRFPVERVLHCVAEMEASLLLVSANGAQSTYDRRLPELVTQLAGARLVNAGPQPLDTALSWEDFLEHGAGLPTPQPVESDAEQPLMILYGKSVGGSPMGGIFATGGYLVQAATSFTYLLSDGREDKPNRRVFNTVDLASSAGQTYSLWGPLLNGGTILLADTNSRPGVDELRSALEHSPLAMLCKPTLIARLKESLAERPFPTQARFSRVVSIDDSLTPRLVTFAANNLTPDATRVLNCWIQNESGVALMCDFAAPELNRAGSLGLPAFGVEPVIINDFGQCCGQNMSGQLAFAHSWPAMIRAVYKAPDKLKAFYFSRFPGYYSTNDGMRRDMQGFFWFMGRLDDVIKAHGHSLATSEVETVLVTHPAVDECAIVGIAAESADELVAFVVPSDPKPVHDPAAAATLSAEISVYIARKLGDFAIPSRVVYVTELPRTATGKVVRRLLRRIAGGDVQTNEDLSHVANPNSLSRLIK